MLQVQARAVTFPSEAGRERQRDVPKEERWKTREDVTAEQKMMLPSARSCLKIPVRLNSKHQF